MSYDEKKSNFILFLGSNLFRRAELALTAYHIVSSAIRSCLLFPLTATSKSLYSDGGFLAVLLTVLRGTETNLAQNRRHFELTVSVLSVDVKHCCCASDPILRPPLSIEPLKASLPCQHQA